MCPTISSVSTGPGRAGQGGGCMERDRLFFSDVAMPVTTVSSIYSHQNDLEVLDPAES